MAASGLGRLEPAVQCIERGLVRPDNETVIIAVMAAPKESVKAAFFGHSRRVNRSIFGSGKTFRIFLRIEDLPGRQGLGRKQEFVGLTGFGSEIRDVGRTVFQDTNLGKTVPSELEIALADDARRFLLGTRSADDLFNTVLFDILQTVVMPGNDQNITLIADQGFDAFYKRIVDLVLIILRAQSGCFAKDVDHTANHRKR